MEKSPVKVAVASVSFCKSPRLRTALLDRFPNAVFNETGKTLTTREIIAFAGEAERLILGTEPASKELLQELPRLRVLSKYGVGIDNVDAEALRSRGVRLAWRKGVNKRSVSELALTFLLSLFHRVPDQHKLLAQGNWTRITGRNLTDKTVGILGFGHVGKDLARLLAPFGCKLIACDIRPDHATAKETNTEFVSLEELLRKADAVSVHLPLTRETRGMLDERRLGLLKTSAILVNTSRGGIIDEDALLRMLSTGKLAGAGLDVFDIEPINRLGASLCALPNVVSTPHVGGSTEEAIFAMGMAAIEGLSTAKPIDDYELLE